MSREEREGVARPGHEGVSDRCSPDVADEVIIPDYVMHDFGFPEGADAAMRRRVVARRRGGKPSGETP
jgi:hypothetical protein